MHRHFRDTQRRRRSRCASPVAGGDARATSMIACQHQCAVRASSRAHVRRSGDESLAGLWTIGLRHGHGGLPSANPRTRWRDTLLTPRRACPEQAALLMGVGTRRPRPWRADRDRHVRLRDADAQRAQRSLFTRYGDIKIRTQKHQERSTSARRELRVLYLSQFLACLPAHLHRIGEISVHNSTPFTIFTIPVLMRELRRSHCRRAIVGDG